MRKLFIPLLAALALPTALSAEPIPKISDYELLSTRGERFEFLCPKERYKEDGKNKKRKLYKECWFELNEDHMNLMDMQKIKRDDEVIVIAGKDKGKRGTVKRVLENRFVVSGVNMIKRHTKPNPMAGNQGGIVEREAPIHASNVAIFNSETGKADRVGFQVKEDGTKVRIYKSTQTQIDA